MRVKQLSMLQAKTGVAQTLTCLQD